MKIGFGSDHAAVELKNILLEHLKEQGYECVDYGAYDPAVKTDYPVQGQKVAEALVRGEVDKGVLVCGTGIGISLAANITMMAAVTILLAGLYEKTEETKYLITTLIIAVTAVVIRFIFTTVSSKMRQDNRGGVTESKCPTLSI